MSQKNETTVLVLALVITAGLLGIGVWWFTNRSGIKTANPPNQQLNQSELTNAQIFAQVTNVPSGLFNYGGSTTWATIRRDIDPALQTVWP